jgi:hypothetical protein
MKKLYSLLILGLFLVLTSCSANLDDIEIGMTETEVEELLGKANQWKSSSNSFTSNGETSTTEMATWTYNGIGTIEFENGVVVSKHK